MRVLIADDDHLVLERLRRALEPVEDIEIVGATHTGAQVLPLVQRRQPDIVALELSMRGDGGASCLELLSAHSPEVKVVIVSASTAYDDIRSALAGGAQAYIVKERRRAGCPLRATTRVQRNRVSGDRPQGRGGARAPRRRAHRSRPHAA